MGSRLWDKGVSADISFTAWSRGTKQGTGKGDRERKEANEVWYRVWASGAQPHQESLKSSVEHMEEFCHLCGGGQASCIAWGLLGVVLLRTSGVPYLHRRWALEIWEFLRQLETVVGSCRPRTRMVRQGQYKWGIDSGCHITIFHVYTQASSPPESYTLEPWFYTLNTRSWQCCFSSINPLTWSLCSYFRRSIYSFAPPSPSQACPDNCTFITVLFMLQTKVSESL